MRPDFCKKQIDQVLPAVEKAMTPAVLCPVIIGALTLATVVSVLRKYKESQN